MPTPQPAAGQEWAAMGCPRCHEDSPVPTLLANARSGHFHCERCGHHGDASIDPRRFRGALSFHDGWWERPLTAGAIKWLAQYGISETVARESGMSVGKAYFEETDCWELALALPCRSTQGGDVADVLYLQVDPAGPRFGPMRRTPGGRPVPWGWDLVEDDRLVLVDHPMDRLALLEAGMRSVACLPDGLDPMAPESSAWGFLKLIEERTRGVQKIVFAFRDNEAGHALEDELARRFGKERCYRTHWSNAGDVEVRDPLMLLERQGPAVMLDAVDAAVPFPIDGVYELYDVEDRFEALYEFGLSRGVTTGWPSLDEHYTVAAGQWTLVTGIPGHGKSSFLDAMLVNIAKNHGWRFGLFSPENQPIERHYASLMEKAVGAPFNDGPTPRITREQKDQYKHWINEHFKHILPPDDEQGSWSVDGVLSYAKVLVYRYGIRGLVMDPWNELDHSRPNYMSETEHISASLTKIRRFAKVHGVHIWLVAHPTKLEIKADGKYPVPTPYNVAGGAHWRNKADNSLTVYRNVGEVDDDISDIHVQKIRFKEIGRVGVVSLRSNRRSGQYFDDIDQDKRRRAMDTGKPVSSDELRTAVRVSVPSRTPTGMPLVTNPEDPLAGPGRDAPPTDDWRRQEDVEDPFTAASPAPSAMDRPRGVFPRGA